MNEVINAIKPITVSRVAGAGNKMVYLLDQKADAYVNLVPGFKFWDMCASEALINSCMGIVTDANQKRIIYDQDQKVNYTIKEGIVVAKNKKVYDVCQNRVKKELGKSIGECHKEILAQIES